MDVDGLKAKRNNKCHISGENVLEYFRSWFSEVEEKRRITDERLLALGLEVGKKKGELQLLEIEFKALEGEKRAVEKLFGSLKRKGDELEQNWERLRALDTFDESDNKENLVWIMAENRDECELGDWKEAFADLEARVSRLVEKCLKSRSEQSLLTGNAGADIHHRINPKNIIDLCMPEGESDGIIDLDRVQSNNAPVDGVEAVNESSSTRTKACSSGNKSGCPQMNDTPSIDTAQVFSPCLNGEWQGTELRAHLESGKRVRKQLFFADDGTASKKVAPSTPVGARSDPIVTIDVSDSDDEPGNFLQAHNVGGGEEEHQKTVSGECLKSPYLGHNDETSGSNENSPFQSTLRRRQMSNVVISDGDNESDDDLPKRKHCGQKFHVSSDTTCTAAPRRQRRRRLVALRCCDEKMAISTNKPAENEEMKTGSESEGESLGGFIVNSSEDFDGNDCSSHHTEGVSSDNFDYGEIISTIGRRNAKSKWEFEADMLAAFGKDPELCMKAVVALYRQQTSDEKCSKGTFYRNGRGFNKIDAHRGTALAEVLMDGDPDGGIKRSKEEMLEKDPSALELCKILATRYSKQLFEIYRNNKDPFFHP